MGNRPVVRRSSFSRIAFANRFSLQLIGFETTERDFPRLVGDLWRTVCVGKHRVERFASLTVGLV